MGLPATALPVVPKSAAPSPTPSTVIVRFWMARVARAIVTRSPSTLVFSGEGM